jgi:hypothetical protein
MEIVLPFNFTMNEMNDASNYGKRIPLPFDYQLHDNDVYCGRGTDCLNHVGNFRFRQIVLLNLDRYNSAKKKHEKSTILNEIVEYIRSSSSGVGFVTKDIETGRFYEVGDTYAVRYSLCLFCQTKPNNT